MLVLTCWFRLRPGPAHADDQRHARLLEASRGLMGEGWAEYSLRGPGWGAVVVHAPAPGWRWPFVAGTGAAGTDAVGARRVTLSLGVPVGTERSTPEELGRALLAGQEVHGDVVPPFAAVVVDEPGGRAVVQQDWLGMARLFMRSAGDVLVLSSRTSLVPVVDGGPAGPDLHAWSGYAASINFRGAEAPVAGLRLLDPGERLHLIVDRDGDRDGDGDGDRVAWQYESSLGRGLDDLAREGSAQRGDGPVPADVAERAAGGMTRAARSLGRLYDGALDLGLSGGKDSRVITAALLSGGITPVLFTNTTTRAEGEVATELVARTRAARGLELDHRLHASSTPAVVVTRPLLERAERVRVRYDFQYASSYLARPPVTVTPTRMRPPSFTGAAGEMVTGYWHPPVQDPGTDEVVRHLVAKLCCVGDLAHLAPATVEAHRSGVVQAVEHAQALGLRGADVCDYVYVAERMRRLNSAAYEVGMVTPFLAPEVVAAAFALTAEQKAGRALHLAVLAALAPEWEGVPFVTSSTGGSPAARIWHGDGLATLEELTLRPPGELAAMVHGPSVRTALATARGGRPTGLDNTLLSQYVTLTVADAAFGTGPQLPEPEAIASRTPPSSGPSAPQRSPRLAWLPPGVRSVARRARRRLAHR